MNTTATDGRPKARHLRRWLHLGVLLAMVIGSCSAFPPGSVAAQLPDDGPPPTVSRTAALSFVEKALTAGQSAVDSKAFTLTVSDSEITSFLNTRSELTQELQDAGIGQLGQIDGLQGLAPGNVNIDVWRSLLGAGSSGGSGGLNLPSLSLGLRDPQVYFKANGDVIARGDLTLLKWKVPVRVIVAPYAGDGKMSLDFVEGQIGSIQLPPFLFDLLGKGLVKALMLGQEYAEITQIQVSAGTLTLSGRYNH